MNKSARVFLVGLILAVVLLFVLSLYRKRRGESFKVEPSGQQIASVRSSFIFRKIPAGDFMMGSPLAERYRDRDGGQKPVKISRPFEMMTTEVTQRQWFEIMKDNPSYFKRQGDCDNHEYVTAKSDKPVGLCPDHPVERVSYKEVKEFIKKLNYKFTGTSCLNGEAQRTRKGCYRLPTEAEWEYAVRAGSKTAYFFGDDPSRLGEYAVYSGNSGQRTHKVEGNRFPNKWGLYDMYGNVWEWVEDTYREELPGGKDPLVTGGSLCVLRGGSLDISALYLHSALRLWSLPDYGLNYFGFRLVKTL